MKTTLKKDIIVIATMLTLAIFSGWMDWHIESKEAAKHAAREKVYCLSRGDDAQCLEAKWVNK